MFARDRDLLALEPGVFSEVAWLSQTLVVGSGSVSDGGAEGGSIVALTSQTVGFDDAGVGDGGVLRIGTEAMEITQRLSATSVRVSKPRTDEDGALIPRTAETGVSVVVATFAPQIALAHRQLLRMAGIEPDEVVAEPSPGLVGEQHVTNPAALVRAEALGALHLIYTAASAAGGPSSELGRRAELYRRRFEAERLHAAVRVDTDGDGQADATRRLNVVQSLRA